MEPKTVAEAILIPSHASASAVWVTEPTENAIALQVGLQSDAVGLGGGGITEEERLKPITFRDLSRALVNFVGLLREPANARPVLRPGDVAAIVMPNSVAFAGAFIGTTISRAVAAPLNPKYTKEEYLFYLEDQKASVVFIPTRDPSAAAIEAANDLGIRILQVDALNDPEWGGVIFTAYDVSDRILLNAGKRQRKSLWDPPQPRDVALLLHTSGTTSKPKGVPLTHSNMCASISNIRRTYEFNESDRSLLVMPLFHVHGLMCGLVTALAARSQVVIPSGGGFSAHMFWKDAKHFEITWYTAVPTIHQVLLLRADKDYPSADPPPLRLIRSSSSSLAPAILEKLEKTFRAPVLEAYAMSEACHQMTSNPLPKYGMRVPGSVGKGMGVQVTILDDRLRELPPRSVGEVCIRGPNVTPGYLNNPKATKEAFAGGWFHTGDQGWLDERGYLTLTGRLKELINRGGEKIAPLEIDSALISHDALAEAVAFGMPDEKYGEVVHAAVVLKEGCGVVTEAELKAHCKSRLAEFKIPIRMHFLSKMPKTATGKVQRRMVRAFILDQDKGAVVDSRQVSSSQGKGGSHLKGFDVVAKCLSSLGVKHMFGIVGIPVTQLATSAQCQGIRFVGFRNEQAAGYAASSIGFLTGHPAALLTVSGPGVVHGLAGLSNATANCWPMLMISGSVERKFVGKGGFQELDQCAAAKPHCKAVFQIRKLSQAGKILSSALHEAMSGRPGGVYVDIPADILFSQVSERADEAILRDIKHISQDIFRFTADESLVLKAANMLSKAKNPLVLVGKGAAYSRTEVELQNFVRFTGIPVLPSAMGKGLIPDSHNLCVGSVRSKAMKESDVILVVGTRLNWQWEFGESPKWSSHATFIVIDTLEPSKRSKHDIGALYLHGDAKTVIPQLNNALYRKGYSQRRIEKWTRSLLKEKDLKEQGLQSKLSVRNHPMDFHTVFGVLSNVLHDFMSDNGVTPIVVNEGANTMDVGRVALQIEEPRSRLDAGTWGTMGVGLGYAIAAALVDPDRPVLAIQGDSAFGFSGMECEVIARYNLRVIVVVLNNGGIYGGDRRDDNVKREASSSLKKIGVSHEPAPTAFQKDCQYELIMKAFGGTGITVDKPEHFETEITRALEEAKPALINVVVDEFSGVESARMNRMNKLTSKL